MQFPHKVWDDNPQNWTTLTERLLTGFCRVTTNKLIYVALHTRTLRQNYRVSFKIKENPGKHQMFQLPSLRPGLCPTPPCAVLSGFEPTVFALSSPPPVQPLDAVFLWLWRKMQSLVSTAWIICSHISQGKLSFIYSLAGSAYLLLSVLFIVLGDREMGWNWAFSLARVCAGSSSSRNALLQICDWHHQY